MSGLENPYSRYCLFVFFVLDDNANLDFFVTNIVTEFCHGLVFSAFFCATVTTTGIEAKPLSLFYEPAACQILLYAGSQ